MQLHWFWILALLVVVLIIFGPGRLPELGAGLGKAMREFRKATNEFTNDVSSATAKPEPPASTTTPASSETSSPKN